MSADERSVVVGFYFLAGFTPVKLRRTGRSMGDNASLEVGARSENAPHL
jgi:hypothetical protein